jgi:hypothetical protein
MPAAAHLPRAWYPDVMARCWVALLLLLAGGCSLLASYPSGPGDQRQDQPGDQLSRREPGPSPDRAPEARLPEARPPEQRPPDLRRDTVTPDKKAPVDQAPPPCGWACHCNPAGKPSLECYFGFGLGYHEHHITCTATDCKCDWDKKPCSLAELAKLPPCYMCLGVPYECCKLN